MTHHRQKHGTGLWGEPPNGSVRPWDDDLGRRLMVDHLLLPYPVEHHMILFLGVPAPGALAGYYLGIAPLICVNARPGSTSLARIPVARSIV